MLFSLRARLRPWRFAVVFLPSVKLPLLVIFGVRDILAAFGSEMRLQKERFYLCSMRFLNRSFQFMCESFFWLSARTSRSVFATALFRCYVEKPANADEVPQIELSVHTGGGFYIDLLAVPFEYPFPGKQGQSPSLILRSYIREKSDVTEWTKNVAVVCGSVSERSFDRQAVFK